MEIEHEAHPAWIISMYLPKYVVYARVSHVKNRRKPYHTATLLAKGESDRLQVASCLVPGLSQRPLS